MSDDELDLLKFVYDGNLPFDYDKISHKRKEYILDKWDRDGHWDYGTSARGGWLTDKGRAWAKGFVHPMSDNLISYPPPLQMFWDEESKGIEWLTPIRGLCYADADGFFIRFVLHDQPRFPADEKWLFEKYLGDNIEDAKKRIAEIVKFFQDEIV